MTSHLHSIPDLTYIDKFCLHLASRLIGSDKLVWQLKQATAEVTASSPSPKCHLESSSFTSPRHHRNGCGGKRSESSSTKPVRFYWRTPLLHRPFGTDIDKKVGSEVKSTGEKIRNSFSVANEKVIFVDVTFDLLLPEASPPTSTKTDAIATSPSFSSSDNRILPPRVQIQFGALVQNNSQPISCQKPLEDCDHISTNSAMYIRGDPITHPDLILHAQQVGIDLEGTTPYALANLMAGALMCSSSHRAFVFSNNDEIHHRGKGTTCCHYAISKEEEYAIKLLLAYDDLGGEEGELLIHSTLPDRRQNEQGNKIDVGFVGGLALDMLLVNFERQDDAFDSNDLCSRNRHRRQQDDSADEAVENMNGQNDGNSAAVEHALKSWWENAFIEISLRHEKKDHTRDGHNSKSLGANLPEMGSSNSVSSSPQRKKKAMGKTIMVPAKGNTPNMKRLKQDQTGGDLLPQTLYCSNGDDKKSQHSQSFTGEPLHRGGSMKAGPLSIETACDTTAATAASPTRTNCNPSHNCEETNGIDCTYAAPFSLSASLPPISPPPKINSHKRRKTSAPRQRGRGVLVLGNSMGGGGKSKRRKRGRITIGR